MAVSNTVMHWPPVVVWTLYSVSLFEEVGGGANEPEPDDGKDAAGQDDEVAEVVAKGHACENGKRSVKLFRVSSVQLFGQDISHLGADSTVDSNDETHKSVAKDTGSDCHFPAETHGDDGRSYATNVSQ